MTIEFNCEGCGKSLKAPEDKAGKTGKCPDCGEPILVPVPERTSEPENPFAVDEPASSFQEAVEATKPCPMCGAGVSSSDVRCPACGEELNTLGGATRRFSSGHKIDIGEVISVAWGRYKQQMGVTIGALLIVMVISGLLSGVVQAVSEENLAIGGLLNLCSIVFNLWIGLGASRFLLNVARGETAEIPQLFSGGKYLGKAILATIVLMLLIFGVALGLGLVAGVAGAVAGPIVVIPVVIVMGILIIMLSLMFYWIQFIIVDIDPPGLSCLSLSRELMSGNYLSVFVLLICAGIIAISGMLLLVVGFLFTFPFAAVIFAVTYDHLSGGDANYHNDY